MISFDPDLKLSSKNWLRWSLLKGLSLIYGTATKARLALYRRNWKQSYHPDIPVISVGNITVGGTGKTPMIDYLLTLCERHQLKAGVLTRGYKAERKEALQILDEESAQTGSVKEFGDEPWQLFQNHPKIKIYVAPDRVQASKLAAQERHLLLLDDGMQHLRLARDLNIVLMDAVSGIGNGTLLPLGPLREELKNLHRADVILYTKTNLMPSQAIRRQLEPWIAAKTPQFDCTYQATSIRSSKTGKWHDPAELNQKRVLLFSGIGNPRGFERSVEDLGATVLKHIRYQDHQEYGGKEVMNLTDQIQQGAQDLILCTEKDWVKIAGLAPTLPEFFWLKMEMIPENDCVRYLETFLKQIRPQTLEEVPRG